MRLFRFLWIGVLTLCLLLGMINGAIGFYYNVYTPMLPVSLFINSLIGFLLLVVIVKHVDIDKIMKTS